MHRHFIPAALAFALASAGTQAANISLSVSGEVSPGVYGRVDIGNATPPVVYAQPMIITRTAVAAPPVYLHVPPGHAKNWGKHCHKYNACGQPVYFIKSAEYDDGPGRGSHGNHGDHESGHGGGHGGGKGKHH